MKRILIGGLVVLCLSVSTAHAVTPSGGPGDEILARVYTSYVNVWSPVIGVVAILGLVAALASGHGIGRKAIAVVAVLVFLGSGGLGLLSGWSGGSIAAGAERFQGECVACASPSTPAP